MEKKMVVAIALSLLVLVVFQVLQPKKVQEAPIPSERAVSMVQESPAQVEGYTPEAVPIAESSQYEEAAPEEITQIGTEKYDLVFSSTGGSLKRIALREFQEDEKEETLIDNRNPAERLFAMMTSLFRFRSPAVSVTSSTAGRPPQSATLTKAIFLAAPMASSLFG